MSARNLRSLGRFLTTLGLDTDKVPSISEYRRAYRSLLHLHPDKAGDDTLSRFQEITEAAKEVFEFLTTNGNLKPEDISVDDIFGTFVQNNNLQFNKKCVTFDLPVDTTDEWIKMFETILGHPSLLTTVRQEYSLRRRAGVLRVTLAPPWHPFVLSV